MAIVSNPLIGKAKKSTGNITFSNWKGLRVMKDKAVSVANPNTIHQQMRRSALAQVSAIAKAISDAVTIGFRLHAVHKTATNAFTSYTLKNAFDYTAPPAATFQPGDMLISKGTIQKTDIELLTASAGTQEAEFHWNSTGTSGGQAGSDLDIMVVFNVTKNTWYAGAGSANRSDGSDTLALPTGTVEGDEIVGFLAFYNAKKKTANSDSYGATVGA